MANQMIEITQQGDFSRTNRFFERALEVFKHGELDKYGKEGVELLERATPKDTGLASSSWYYIIERSDGKASIVWCNDDIEGNQNVVILLQYGHATKSGSYVEGIDFINPALAPLFNRIAEEALEEVTKN